MAAEKALDVTHQVGRYLLRVQERGVSFNKYATGLSYFDVIIDGVPEILSSEWRERLDRLGNGFYASHDNPGEVRAELEKVTEKEIEFHLRYLANLIDARYQGAKAQLQCIRNVLGIKEPIV